MLFNDLTYRSLVSARASVPQEIEVSARTSTLAYLLDSGYVTTQVLAVTKLLDPRRDVISVMRLLNDVRSRRKVITREIYVSGTGFPYEPKPTESDSYTPSPEEAEFGLTTSNHNDWIQSYHLHETFDRLSRKNPSNRSREDVISDSVFKRLHSWLETPSIQKLDTLRDKFLAHAANATQRAGNKNEGVRFAELDEA
jgi:hypothetical protein